MADTGAAPHDQPFFTVTLEKHLEIFPGSRDSIDGLPNFGLVLFSSDAWQGWRKWQQDQSHTKSSPAVHIELSLLPYIVRQAEEDKVLGVISDLSFISLSHPDQDRAQAAARLIMAGQGSPWGKGYLETALNLKLARKILPRVLSTPITPNQITVINLFIGLIAVLGFAWGTYWASLGAALLLALIITLDCLDGWVARLKFQESQLGSRLDFYGDTVLNLLIFWGIAFGQYQVSGWPLILGLGLLLTLGYGLCWWILDHPEIRPQAAPDSPPGRLQKGSKTIKDGKIFQQAVSRDFFYIILLGALLNGLDWLIIGIAVGTNIFALFLYRRRYGQA